MPRLTKSKGRVIFITPFLSELQRYLCYELENNKHWNPTQVTGGMVGANRWKYQWVENGEPITIEYIGTRIICTTANPVIHIRKGLSINMGKGQIIIED